MLRAYTHSELKPGMVCIVVDNQYQVPGNYVATSFETNSVNISGKECVIVCVNPENAPDGKIIGVCFKQQIIGGHTCDGMTPNRQGYWVLPDHLYSKEVHTAHKTAAVVYRENVKKAQEIVNNFLEQ